MEQQRTTLDGLPWLDLGGRILRAARPAVAVHLFESARERLHHGHRPGAERTGGEDPSAHSDRPEDETLGQRIRAGGAGPGGAAGEALSALPRVPRVTEDADDRPARSQLSNAAGHTLPSAADRSARTSRVPAGDPATPATPASDGAGR